MTLPPFSQPLPLSFYPLLSNPIVAYSFHHLTYDHSNFGHLFLANYFSKSNLLRVKHRILCFLPFFDYIHLYFDRKVFLYFYQASSSSSNWHVRSL